MSSLFHCLVHTGPAQMSDQSLRSSLPALLGAVAVSKAGCRFPSIARIFASRAESVTRPAWDVPGSYLGASWTWSVKPTAW